jgi:translation elongation factor EF-1alpha
MEMFTIRYHVFTDSKQFNGDNTRTTEHYRWYKVPTLDQARRKLKEKITDLDESYAVSIDIYGGNARTLRQEGGHCLDF